jgi:hypothetical protein
MANYNKTHHVSTTHGVLRAAKPKDARQFKRIDIQW